MVHIRPINVAVPSVVSPGNNSMCADGIVACPYIHEPSPVPWYLIDSMDTAPTALRGVQVIGGTHAVAVCNVEGGSIPFLSLREYRQVTCDDTHICVELD